MATLYPKIEDIQNLKPPLTPGEKYITDFLVQILDSSWEIFVQPYMNGDKPDIVLLNKNRGMLFIEVKDYQLNSYSLSGDKFEVRTPAGLHRIQNPYDQVYRYKKDIYEYYMVDLWAESFRYTRYWKLIGCMLYFHNSNSTEIDSFFQLKNGFNPKYWTFVLGRDDLQYRRFNMVLNTYFRNKEELFDEKTYFRFKNILQPPFHSSKDGKLVDLSPEQKKHAVPKPGKHRVRGSAGSGKTQVLGSRTATLAENGYKVLVTFFNISLRNYIKDRISDYRKDFYWGDIEIKHFHKFCVDFLKSVDVYVPPVDETGDFWIDTILSLIQNNKDKISEFEKYDAIMIDEGQDFQADWLDVLNLFLKERQEVFIVVDERQNVYEKDLSWTGIGRWGELKKSYRLPEKVINIANSFAGNYLPGIGFKVENTQIDAFETLEINNNTDVVHILTDLVDRVYELVSSSNGSHPSDIAIIVDEIKYGRKIHQLLVNKHILLDKYIDIAFENNSEFEKAIDDFFSEKKIRVVKNISLENKVNILRQKHLWDKFDNYLSWKIRRLKKQLIWEGDGKIKISTIHSYKGWEAKNIFLYLSSNYDNYQNHEQVYAAITRSRQNLYIYNSSNIYRDFLSKWT